MFLYGFLEVQPFSGFPDLSFIERFLDRFDRLQRIEQTPVVDAAVACPDGSRLGVDKSFALQLIHVFLHGVVTHTDRLPDGSVTWMAPEGFPILAIHQESENGDLSGIEIQTEDRLGQRKKITGMIPAGCVILTYIQ